MGSKKNVSSDLTTNEQKRNKSSPHLVDVLHNYAQCLIFFELTGNVGKLHFSEANHAPVIKLLFTGLRFSVVFSLWSAE